jgi:hypothetical protein
MLIEFDDESKINFEIKENELTITIQARHFGEKIKFISLTTTLNKEQTLELNKLIRDKIENI